MDYMSGFVFLMDDFVRGVRVKLRPSDEQKALFNQNFGCCRKAHNEVLARYTTLHGEDYSKVPTKSELNKLLMEAKAESLTSVMWSPLACSRQYMIYSRLSATI